MCTCRLFILNFSHGINQCIFLYLLEYDLIDFENRNSGGGGGGGAIEDRDGPPEESMSLICYLINELLLLFY